MKHFDKSEILDFIHRRFATDCHWLDGNCYYFALILSERFFGDIYYDGVAGHFITLIDGSFYDWTGEVQVDNKDIMRWSKLQLFDPVRAERIKQGCIR